MEKQSISMTEIKPLTNVRSPILTINQIKNEVIRMFDDEYSKLHAPRYELRQKYGKYMVLKFQGNKSEVLVKGVSKEVAEGYLKLLKEE